MGAIRRTLPSRPGAEARVILLSEDADRGDHRRGPDPGHERELQLARPRHHHRRPRHGLQRRPDAWPRRAGNGNHYFLEDTAAIEDVFTEELSYSTTVPVAFATSACRSTPGAGHVPARATASFWQSTTEGGHLDNPSVFIAHRMSKCAEPAAGAAAGPRSSCSSRRSAAAARPDGADVATIDVSQPGSSTPTAAQVVVLFQATTSRRSIVARHHQEEELRDVNLYQAIERACGDFHSGQGTAIVLRAQAAAADYDLTAEGGSGDLDTNYDIELLQQLIDVMVAFPPAPPRRTRSWWPTHRHRPSSRSAGPVSLASRSGTRRGVRLLPGGGAGHGGAR